MAMIPNSYNKLKLSQYGTVREIITSASIVGIDKDLKILSFLSGKPFEYFNEMEFGELDLWQKQISFLWKPVPFKLKKYILIHRRLFKVITDVSEVSGSIYLGLKHHAEKGDINGDNMHNALSQIIKPFSLFKKENSIKQQNETAEWLKKYANVGEVQSPLFFYSVTYEQLNNRMATYLMKEQIKMNPIAESEVVMNH